MKKGLVIMFIMFVCLSWRVKAPIFNSVFLKQYPFISIAKEIKKNNAVNPKNLKDGGMYLKINVKDSKDQTDIPSFIHIKKLIIIDGLNDICFSLIGNQTYSIIFISPGYYSREIENFRINQNIDYELDVYLTPCEFPHDCK